MLNCAVILEGPAQVYPERMALVSAGERWSYQALNGLACRVANGLRRAGIQAGDKVLLACPNRLEFIVSYFGILKIGATVVPVSILSKKRELIHMLKDTGARAFVCFEGDEDLRLGVEGIAAWGKVDSCRHFWLIPGRAVGGVSEAPLFSQLLEGMGGTFESSQTEPNQTAVILYTSGTTGRSKGAELSHQVIFSAAATAGQLGGLTVKDIHLVVLPLFHCYAQTVQMNAGFMAGCILVLLPRFDPDEVLGTLEKESVTVFCGVPTMYWSLLHHEGDYDREKISRTLRLGISGGAPIPVEVLKGVEEKYRITVLEGYGLSETSAMATFNQEHRPRKYGSVGLSVWGMEVRVVDSEMNDVPLGERGELVLRGHAVMKGYLNQPELTAEAFRGGWFHTGDVGTKDEEGYYYIVDRTKDMILRGGFNVYPREVEEVLLSHPEITLAAVVGMPHEKYGEEVVAFVLLVKGSSLTGAEIISWAREEMASYKYPRLVKIEDSLPLGATGKVLKTELRRRLAEESKAN